MKHDDTQEASCCCCRRDFLQAMGAAVGGTAIYGGAMLAAAPASPQATAKAKRVATIRGAFLYPPPETLEAAGYWSWPGSGFNPRKRQAEYLAKIAAIEKKLAVRIVMDTKPIDAPADAARFVADVKRSAPDGLLLIPFQKAHWQHVVRIVEEAKIPAVVLATLGVLLVDHIKQLHRKPGAYLVSALDDFGAVESGMNMIRAARWMKDARLLSVTGSQTTEAIVPHLGTELRTVPHARFVEEFKRQEITPAVRELAEAYRAGAKEIVEPSPEDILQSARACFALKRLAEAEKADAMMVECLSGLRLPHQHVPPCMGFMTLRDEGFPIGCQADLSATLTLMLVEQLFGRPGFQQNAAMDTEKNLYFGSHCTAPSKMNGRGAPAEPFILRSHAEAGWGCVPRVLFTPGQQVTMAQYLPAKSPQMLIYSGRIVGCPPIPPTGGCRSNVQIAIDGVADVCDVKGMHQIIFYGNHAKALRTFCQLCGIQVLT